MKKFRIKIYRFGELARMYYPDRDYDSALRMFHRELHNTCGLWKALTAEGYKEGDRLLTRSQVKAIVKFLGEP